MGQTISQELIALGERVTSWRKAAGGRGSRIPDKLWQEAVRVARVDGVYATSRVTRFNYRGLSERMQKAQAVDRISVRPKPQAPPFVELQMTPCRMDPSPTAIELISRRGDRMRLDVNGSIDVVGLVQAFCGRRP